MPPPHDHLPSELLTRAFRWLLDDLDTDKESHRTGRQHTELRRVCRRWGLIAGSIHLPVHINPRNPLWRPVNGGFTLRQQFALNRTCQVTFQDQNPFLYNWNVWDELNAVRGVLLMKMYGRFDVSITLHQYMMGGRMNTLRALDIVDCDFKSYSFPVLNHCEMLHRLKIHRDTRLSGDVTFSTDVCASIGALKCLHTLELAGMFIDDWRALFPPDRDTLRELTARIGNHMPLDVVLPRLQHLTHLDMLRVSCPENVATRDDGWLILPWPPALARLTCSDTSAFIPYTVTEKLEHVWRLVHMWNKRWIPMNMLPAPLLARCPDLMRVVLGKALFAHPDSALARSLENTA